MTAGMREARSLDASLLSTGRLVVSRAQGSWLFTESGERFFDATGGSGAVNLGHQHPRVVAAVRKQAERLLHTGWNLRSTVREALIEKLGFFSPYSPCGVLLTVTGAEGVEAALKVARAYTGRRTVIAFERAYHGKTAGALAVTWRAQFREFSPEALAAPVRFVPYPLPGEERGPAESLQSLEWALTEAAAEGAPAAAVILEPVQAAEGFLAGGEPFLREVLRLARVHGAIPVFDEIYTGFGRSGTRFFASRPGLDPDLLVVGKALGNGLPISAVLGDPSLLDVLAGGTHSSTFAGHPLACAVGAEVIDVMLEARPWYRAREAGAEIRKALHDMAVSVPGVGPPRGEGLMLAFECLDHDGSPSAAAAHAFAEAALQAGVVLRHGGWAGSTIKLTPPLLLNDGDVEFLVSALRAAAEGAALAREDAHALL